jgi:hypothetical protein
MSNKLITASVLSMTLLVTACGGAQSTQSVTKGQERSGGLFGMVKSDEISVDGKAAFKGTEKVTIGSFLVGFAVIKTDSSKAGGGLMGSGFGGRSTAKSTLNGIDDATMQYITDQAYKQFVADLKARGFTVVDRSGLLANKSFAESKTYTNPHEETSGIFGTNSQTKYFAPSSFDAMRIFMGDIQGVTGGFGFSNPAIGAMEYAKESGVKVLNVTYVIDFANADSYGSWATRSSSVKVGQGITVVPEFSRVGLTGGDAGSFSSANGNIRLGQPISSVREFATVESANSDAYKAAEVAVNVIGVLGGVGSNSTREFEFSARPKDYKEGAMDAIEQANVKFIDTMASLK